jgi:4-hydroxy-tetrahydrodipicolinate reductase
MTLVAAIDRSRIGDPIGPLVGHPEVKTPITDELDVLLQSETEVAVDFTHPDTVVDNIRWAVQHAVHIVVGTTGITGEHLEEIRALIDSEGNESNVIVAPNFAIGAVLAERFAVEASKFFPAAEIIELHHDGKADAPSGTALAAARRIAAERVKDYRGPYEESVSGVRGGEVDGIRVHSVRLPGLVAHEEIIFGAQGQTLTIRHDAMDRSSFMPGVVMAINAVTTRPGLTVGIGPLLEGK